MVLLSFTPGGSAQGGNPNAAAGPLLDAAKQLSYVALRLAAAQSLTHGFRQDILGGMANTLLHRALWSTGGGAHTQVQKLAQGTIKGTTSGDNKQFLEGYKDLILLKDQEREKDRQWHAYLQQRDAEFDAKQKQRQEEKGRQRAKEFHERLQKDAEFEQKAQQRQQHRAAENAAYLQSYENRLRSLMEVRDRLLGERGGGKSGSARGSGEVLGTPLEAYGRSTEDWLTRIGKRHLRDDELNAMLESLGDADSLKAAQGTSDWAHLQAKLQNVAVASGSYREDPTKENQAGLAEALRQLVGAIKHAADEIKMKAAEAGATPDASAPVPSPSPAPVLGSSPRPPHYRRRELKQRYKALAAALEREGPLSPPEPAAPGIINPVVANPALPGIVSGAVEIPLTKTRSSGHVTRPYGLEAPDLPGYIPPHLRRPLRSLGEVAREGKGIFDPLGAEEGGAVDSDARRRQRALLGEEGRLTQASALLAQTFRRLSLPARMLHHDMVMEDKARVKAYREMSAVDKLRYRLGTPAMYAQAASSAFTVSTGAASGLLQAASPDALDTLLGSFKILAAEIGQTLIPGAVRLSVYAQELAQQFAALSPATKRTIGNLITYGIAGLGAALALGKVVSVATSLAQILGYTGLRAQATGLAMTALAAAVGLAVAGYERDEAHKERIRGLQDRADNPDKDLGASVDPSYQYIRDMADPKKRTEAIQRQLQFLNKEEQELTPQQEASRKMNEGIVQDLVNKSYAMPFLGNITRVTGHFVAGATDRLIPGAKKSNELTGLEFDQSPRERLETLTQRLADVRGRKKLYEDLIKGITHENPKAQELLQNAAFAMSSVKGQAGYSSIEDAYKRIQVEALGKDPITQKLEQIQRESFDEMLAELRKMSPDMARIADGMRGVARVH